MDANLTEPVIGFRSWWLYRGQLFSLWAQTPRAWTVRAMRARCQPPGESQQGDHHAPDPGCDCGIYAYHSIEMAGLAGASQIGGAAMLWGEIQVYGQGLRAEWARPIALTYGPKRAAGWFKQAQRAACRHRVPLVPRDELAAVAAEYGAPVPRSLIPVEPVREFLAQGVWWRPNRRHIGRTLARLDRHQMRASLLAEAHLDLVLHEARCRDNRRLPLLLLLRQAMVGLLRAAEYYEPDVSWPFAVWALGWIRAAFARALEPGAFAPAVLTYGELLDYLPGPEPRPSYRADVPAVVASSGAASTRRDERLHLAPDEIKRFTQELVEIDGLTEQAAGQLLAPWKSPPPAEVQ